jgi:rhamnosyltransferase
MNSPQDLQLLWTGTRRSLAPRPDRLVSIILPIKNRARNARALLSRIHTQRCEVEIEVIAVDSGSTDDTVTTLADCGATVYAVPPSQFDYGLTRNAAACRAQGDVFVFITSTMLPADNLWLRHLLDALDSDRALAGVYSRSIPRQDADILNYRDYLLADLRTNRREARNVDGLYVRSIDDRSARTVLPPSRMRHLISFSNVSAAIRPEVLRALPFRSVTTCGEDMLWAREALEAGHKIGYATSSIVLYSHNYSWGELFLRSFDDAGGSAAFAGTEVEDATVVPTVLASIRNDWNYLTHGCHLSSGELVHWKVQSVIRRCGQVIGQWLGAHRQRSADMESILRQLEQLPGGSRPTGRDGFDVVQYPGVVDAAAGCLTYGRLAAMGFRAAQPMLGSAREFAEVVEARIADDWSRLTARVPAEDVPEVELDLAVRRLAHSIGAWLGGLARSTPEWARERLSLLGAIKSGTQTSEMQAQSALDEPVTSDWSVDLEALRRVITAEEAEILVAERELDQRAIVMQRMYDDIVHRDETIRGLQEELHRKVGARDETIRLLQAASAHDVEERDRIIRDLQQALGQSKST